MKGGQNNNNNSRSITPTPHDESGDKKSGDKKLKTKSSKKGLRKIPTKQSIASTTKKTGADKYKLMNCIVHPEQQLNHYSTSMREFVCT